MFGRSPLSGDDAPQGVSEPLFRNSPAPASDARAAATIRPGSGQAPPTAAPAPASRPRSAMSLLAAAFRFEGDVVGEGELQLDGQVKGDIRVARLMVGSGARVEGAVRAHHVEVRGTVIGAIEAQVVFLYEGAHVEGDISHGRLSIEGGAYFEGRVQPLTSRAEEAVAAPAQEAPRLRAVEAAPAAAAPVTPA